MRYVIGWKAVNGMQTHKSIYSGIISLPLMHRLRIILASIFCLSLGALPTFAATLEHADVPGPGVIVKDDLYVAGKIINITREVQGDLLAAGGDISVSKKVSQDLMAAGGTINITSDVGDDMRVAGGEIFIKSKIGGDLVIFGGTVILDAASVVGRDLIITGGEVVVHGRVIGNVRAKGGRITLNGVVDGNLIAEAGELHLNGRVLGYSKVSGEEVHLGSSAKFGKKVEYWSPAGPMSFGAAATDTLFSPSLERQQNGKKTHQAKVMLASTFMAFSFLAAALVMGLLIIITKKYFADVATQLRKDPWWSLLYGFLYVIVTPVLSVILMITIIGLPLGLFFFFGYIFSLVFALPVTALVVGKLLQIKYKKKWGKGMFFLVSVGVLVVLKLLAVIPLIGLLIKLLLILAVLGALMTTKCRKWKLIA